MYLDQWVWIRLAKAAKGEPREASDLQVLAAVQDAAAEGVAFPLSATHHIETSKVTSPRQRLIALTMASVSHCRTLRARKVVLRHQMLHAMHLSFGRPGLPSSGRRKSSGPACAGPSKVSTAPWSCAARTAWWTRPPLTGCRSSCARPTSSPS